MKARFINENVGDVLKPKSSEEVKNELSKISKSFFTVGDLKKLLENIPDYLPVGVVGHYGEFFPMNKRDFYSTRANPQGKEWPNILNIDMPILQITTPDIGEEPY